MRKIVVALGLVAGFSAQAQTSETDKSQYLLLKSLENVGNYMSDNFRSDVLNLHSCARGYGQAFNFTPNPNMVPQTISACAAQRNIYLTDCQREYPHQACMDASGIIIMSGLFVDKPIIADKADPSGG
ncbi:MAG: hypothetical protein SOH81_07995 [Acetobacter sp.]|jgi:hypothetical protein